MKGQKIAGIRMRSRVRAAALVTLAGALWATSPARADSVSIGIHSPNLILASASDAPAVSPMRSPMFSDWALDGSAFFTHANGVTAGGIYADRAPIIADGNASSLRSISASATLAPGVALDVSRWRSPSLNPWDSHVASPFGRPLFAGLEMRSPYVGLGSSGSYIGASFALSDELQFHIGRASSSVGFVTDGYTPMPRDLLARVGANLARIETETAGFDWNLNAWSALGISASHDTEFGSVLGSAVAAPLTTSATAETAALGISARVGFGEGWVTTIAYNQGVTQLNLNQSSFVANFEPLRSQAFGFAVAKQGLFGDDSLGIAVSRPLQLNLASNLAANGVPASSYTPNTASAHESDIQLGYVTTFLDGALALQANAAYQVNANGDKGQDAVSVLSSAKIKF